MQTISFMKSHRDKSILTLVFSTLLSFNAMAQDVSEGSSYYLPKTAIEFSIMIEKTTQEPGDLCMYAERFLKKKDVATESGTAYRILNIKMGSRGIPDTAKVFNPAIDAKHSIASLKVDEQGIILGVNAEVNAPEPTAVFVPALKPAPLNARDYLTQDILSAGSMAKMAELTAQEIYDIRDSKSQLNKGQADFMPKDGEQLRIMLNNLNTQETALLQLFEGTAVKDTVETIITFVPEKATDEELLFRFSAKFGLTDTDDLAGEPYYIKVEDLHKTVSNTATMEDAKKRSDDANIYANLPGKIKVTLFKSDRELATKEFYAAQFGKTLPLDNELFGKKLFTSLIYNPVTGNIDTIKTEMVKK